MVIASIIKLVLKLAIFCDFVTLLIPTPQMHTGIVMVYQVRTIQDQ